MSAGGRTAVARLSAAIAHLPALVPSIGYRPWTGAPEKFGRGVRGVKRRQRRSPVGYRDGSGTSQLIFGLTPM
jgi:hypothetical protein